MALVFTAGDTLYVVLDEENVARILDADPFDFDQRNAVGPLALTFPLKLCIAYATKEEHARLANMTTSALVAHLRRGYRETASDFERAIPLATLRRDEQ